MKYVKFTVFPDIIPQQSSFHKWHMYTAELNLWEGSHILKIENVVFYGNL